MKGASMTVNDLAREYCMIEMEGLNMMDCGRMMRSILPIPMVRQSIIIRSQSPSQTTPSMTPSL